LTISLQLEKQGVLIIAEKYQPSTRWTQSQRTVRLLARRLEAEKGQKERSEL
jgi:hypothetical protein